MEGGDLLFERCRTKVVLRVQTVQGLCDLFWLTVGPDFPLNSLVNQAEKRKSVYLKNK